MFGMKGSYNKSRAGGNLVQGLTKTSVNSMHIRLFINITLESKSVAFTEEML